MSSNKKSRFTLALLAVLLLALGGCAGSEAEPEAGAPDAATSSDDEILSEGFESGTTGGFDDEVEDPEDDGSDG